MICGVQRLRLPLQQAYKGPANKWLKTHEYSDGISKILSKPIRIAAKYGFASSNFHKTHANKSECKGIFKKPTAFLSLCSFFSLKPMQIKAKTKEYSKNPLLSSASADYFP